MRRIPRQHYVLRRSRYFAYRPLHTPARVRSPDDLQIAIRGRPPGSARLNSGMDGHTSSTT